MNSMMRPVLLAAVVVAALAMGSPVCPEDSSSAYFTGNTRTSVSGQLLYEYKCSSYGHLFWARP